jgi:hypothetical protein
MRMYIQCCSWIYCRMPVSLSRASCTSCINIHPACQHVINIHTYSIWQHICSIVTAHLAVTRAYTYCLKHSLDRTFVCYLSAFQCVVVPFCSLFRTVVWGMCFMKCVVYSRSLHSNPLPDCMVYLSQCMSST